MKTTEIVVSIRTGFVYRIVVTGNPKDPQQPWKCGAVKITRLRKT